MDAPASFWVRFERAEAERLELWLDVPPALCFGCGLTKRGVLLGVCADCAPKH